MDKISVIIPAYNAEASIRRCVKSVESGKCDLFDLEIVIVDDGSSDNTLTIANDLEAKSGLIKVYSQKNQGVAEARNTGLRMATGNLVAWCDSDDWVCEEWLPHLYKHLIEEDADISVCRASIDGIQSNYNPSELLVFNNDEAIGQFIEHRKLNGCLTNKLIKRELFDNIEFCRGMQYWEDLFVMWKVLKRAKKVVKCNEGTYHITVHPESLCSQKISENRLWATFKVWDMIIDDCRLNLKYKHHLLAAEETRRNWLIGGLKNIMTSHQFFPQYETRIQRVIREGGIRGICRQRGIFDKLFAMCAAINLNMTRKLIMLVKH